MGTYRSNEDAVAYGWFAICVILLISAALFLCIIAIVNETTPQMNKDISDGKMSQQTWNAVSFNRQMINSIPFWIIVGTFVFAVVRSIAKKAGG